MNSKPTFRHVFLSYSHADAQMMFRIRNELESMGIKVWTDEGLIPGTESWKTTIEENIRDALGIIVILSPSAKQSLWVERELEYASVHGIRIFPVLVQGEPAEAIPIELINAQWIDVRDEANFSSQMQKLVQALKVKPGMSRDVLEHPGLRYTSTLSQPSKSTKNLTILISIIIGVCLICTITLTILFGPTIIASVIGDGVSPIPPTTPPPTTVKPLTDTPVTPSPDMSVTPSPDIPITPSPDTSQTEDAFSGIPEPICPPYSIKVIYPNGGEIWEKEKPYTIRWIADSSYKEVRIMLKGGGDSSGGWFTVAFNTPNDGEFEYRIPANYGYDKFRIFVQSPDNSIEDASDNEFFALQDAGNSISAPTLLSPCNGASFSHFPRVIKLEWLPMLEAAAYKAEVDWVLESDTNTNYLYETQDTSILHEHPVAQSGRWRVWAVSQNGEEGPKSDWWLFDFEN